MAEKNKQLKELIIQLSILGEKSKAWKSVSRILRSPSRNLRKVNLYQIEKNAKDKLAVVVPGKVLGIGDITKKVDVVCYQASESAVSKIKKAGGKVLFISDYIKKNPQGKGIMILG